MNTVKTLSIFLLLFFSFRCYSQQIENVDFKVEDNFVIVTYDLVNCPSRELYDIKLKVIYNNNTIVPSSVNGDLKKVHAGKNKKIEWNVLSDKSELKGKIQVMVEISHTFSTKITDGPSNMFLSILVPGLGVKNVTGGTQSGFTRTLGAYGLIVGGVACKLLSDFEYENYHNATLQSDMDTYYESANRFNKVSYVLTAAGIAVWIFDIVWVADQGFKNKKEQKKYNSKLGFHYIPENNGLSLSFKITF